MGKKVSGWVPPSDAVEVGETPTWTPPHNAVEVEKKNSILENSPERPKPSPSYGEIYQDPEILKAQNKQQGVYTLSNGLTEEQDKVKSLSQLPLNEAKPAKDPGFWESLWTTSKSGLTDQLPKEYYTQRLRMSKGTLGDAFDPRHDINAYGDQLQKLGVSRDQYGQWLFKQDDNVRQAPDDEKARLFLNEKYGPEGYEKIKNKFEELNQSERAGYEKEIQKQNQEATDKNGNVVQDLRDINSGQKLLSFLGNSVGQALYRIPTSLLTGTTGSIVSESSAIYDRQLDLISHKTGLSREEIIKQGLDKPAAGQALAVLAGGLDAVSAGGVLGVFRKAAGKQLTNSLLKELPKQFVKGGLFEGVTEGTQGEIEEKAASNGANTEYVPDAWRIATGFTGGFVGGGGLSMVESIVDKYRNNEQPKNESGGNTTEKASGEPIQRNAEQPQEQRSETPVQPSAKETGRFDTEKSTDNNIADVEKKLIELYKKHQGESTKPDEILNLESLLKELRSAKTIQTESIFKLPVDETKYKDLSDEVKEDVDINKIAPSQKIIMDDYVENPDPNYLPSLIKVGDKYIVDDGHHRIAKAIKAGDNKVKAKVRKIKSIEENQSSDLEKNSNLQDNEKGTTEPQAGGFQSVPSGSEPTQSGSTQKSAEDVVAGVHRAVAENGSAQTEEQIRKSEESALEQHAKDNGTWIEDPYKTFGEIPHAHGAEQIVYMNPDGKNVTKVNSGALHHTWKDFLNHIALHNKFDPSVPYKLIGFTKHSGDFAAVIEQPLVKGKEASLDEINDDMTKNGFTREGDTPFNNTTYHNPELGITVKDLHSNNVIKSDEGNFHYIDPIIEPYDKELHDSLNETQNTEAKPSETINQPTDGKVNEKGRQEGQQNVLNPQKETVNKEQSPSEFENNNGPISNQSEQPAGEPTGTQPSTEETNPPPPATEGTTGPNSEGGKERTIGTRYLNDPEVSDELKSGLSEEGQYYIPTTDLKRQADADAYIEAKGIDQAMNDITDPKNGMSDDNRVFIGKTIYKMLKEEVKTSEKPDAVRDKINRLVEDIAKMGTKAGQTVQAFANMFTSDAEQVAHALKREYENTRKEAIENAQPQLQNLQSLIDQATDDALKDLLNDPRIKKLIEDSNISSKNRQSKRKQFTQKILSKLDELEKQIDDSMKGGHLNADLTFGLAPLAYKAAINIIRVAVKAGDSFITAVEKAVNEINKENPIWDEQGFRKQFEEDINQEQKSDRKTLYQALKESGDDFKKLAEEHYKSYANKKSEIISVLEDKFNLDPQESERLIKTLDKIVGEKRQKLIEQKFAPKVATPKKKRTTKQLADKIKEFTDLGVMSEKKLRDAYLESIGLPLMTDEQAIQMEKLVEKAEAKPEGFQRFEAVQDMIKHHQKMTPVSWQSVGEAIWYANMLSGLSTHKINFEANAVRTLSETFVSAIQAIAEYKNPKVALKNTSYMLKGMVDGYKRYLSESANVLKNGYSPMRGKYDSNMFSGVKTSQPSVLETLDTKNPLNLWKYVGRLMTASDILFYGGLKHMRAHQLAFRDAYSDNHNTFDKNTLSRANEYLGKTDVKLQAAKNQAESEGLTGRNYNRRVSEILEQGWKEENRSDTNSFASKGTYNYDPEGVMALMVGVVNHMTQKIPLLKTVVPFSRVIANVTNDYLDYTPWGLVRSDIKKGMGIPNKPSYKRFTPEERLRERIKALAGTTAMMTLYALSQPGDDGEEPYLDITSDGTGNFKNNFELGRTGWKEYTAKPKGSDIRFDYRNTQLAIPFAAIGYINDAQKYKNLKLDDNQLGLIFSGIFHFISDLSFLSGLSDFFEILTDEKEIGQKLIKFAERTAKTAILPNAFTQVSRSIQEITDTPMKKGDDFYGQLFRDFPILRDSKGDMYNTLGEPIVTETLYKFNPMKMSTMADERDKDSYKLWQLIVDNKAWIGSPSKATKIYDPALGIERQLTDEEYDKFALQAAKYTKEMLLEYYDKMAEEKDPKKIKDFIYDLKEEARKRAKNEVLN